MKVGDLVINLYNKDDGIGVIVEAEQAFYGMFRVYWHFSNTSVWFHEGSMEAWNESR